MKKQLLSGLTSMILLASCNGLESTYERTISNFVQTDKSGTWIDLQFKVLEMGEPTQITVGDSICILIEAFEANKARQLASVNEGIERNQKSLEKEKLAVMRKFYQDYIDKNQRLVDSLSTLVVTLPAYYKDKETSYVLAKEITCKFSIVSPMYNTRQEMSHVFVLSDNGKKCYRRKQASSK